MPDILLEHFQFEMLRISNHTACRFAEKARFSRSLRLVPPCVAASRLSFGAVLVKTNVLLVLPNKLAELGAVYDCLH